MKVFVTVGTTEFDQLIRVLDCTDFVESLCLLKCDHLCLQIGRGLYEPMSLPDLCRAKSIKLEVFRFQPSLDAEMSSSSLIISHCGAGSILEAVRYRKSLIVVVNNSLQDNHQTELSDALTEVGFCVSTVPEQFLDSFRQYATQRESLNERETCDINKSVEIPINNPMLFQNVLRSMFDFADT